MQVTNLIGSVVVCIMSALFLIFWCNAIAMKVYGFLCSRGHLERQDNKVSYCHLDVYFYQKFS